MEPRVDFFIQLFERRTCDAPITSRRIPVSTRPEAVRLARLAAPHFVGVVAFSLSRSAEGEVWLVSYLDKYGELPADLRQSLITD